MTVTTPALVRPGVGSVGNVIIQTSDLTKRYGEADDPDAVVAVDHLNLKVKRGEVFGLLGPNGAGKTTTILMLLGLTEPTAGTAWVDGINPTRHPLHVKSQVGYVPDNVGFYEDLTARGNLRYTAQLNRVPHRLMDERIDGLLEDVGLTSAADRTVGGYSRGMRQRLGLADALVKDPSILVLDEPTVNIDPEGVRELLLLVERLRTDQGMTVLLSSHLLHQVEQVCDRIGIFVKGRLVTVGTVDELAADLDDRVVLTVGLSGLDNPREVLAVPGVTSITRDEGRWSVAADRDVRDELVAAIVAAGGRLNHLTRDDADLDAIYHRYFGGEARMTATTVPADAAPADEAAAERPTRFRGGWRIVARKEFTDHITSVRFLILLVLVALAGLAAVHSASGPIRDAADSATQTPSIFLYLFTLSPERVPAFHEFLGILGPLLGIAFGFDAINGERAQGTLPRLVSQPIHRDEIINGKFVAGLAAIALTLACLIAIVGAYGAWRLGVGPSPGDLVRIFAFYLVAVAYIALWLALSLWLSVVCRRAATAALAAIALWLVLTLFAGLIAGVIADTAHNVPANATTEQVLANARLELQVRRISPDQLYKEATGVLLNPSRQSTGIVVVQQDNGALPTSLPLIDSLVLAWWQLVVLIALAVVMFAAAYTSFMRQEVRA